MWVVTYIKSIFMNWSLIFIEWKRKHYNVKRSIYIMGNRHLILYTTFVHTHNKHASNDTQNQNVLLICLYPLFEGPKLRVWLWCIANMINHVLFVLQVIDLMLQCIIWLFYCNAHNSQHILGFILGSIFKHSREIKLVIFSLHQFWALIFSFPLII